MTARSQVQRGQVGGEHRASRRQLLEATRSSAALRAAGVQFEGDISYAGLNQLLLPLLDDLDVLDPVHRDALRVAAEARGNPLALVELPTALSAEQRATLAAVPAVLPLSERLQALFASRVAEPPARSRELLLLAALDGTGDLTGYPLAVGVLPGQARSFRAAQTVVHAPPARAPVRGLRG